MAATFGSRRTDGEAGVPLGNASGLAGSFQNLYGAFPMAFPTTGLGVPFVGKAMENAAVDRRRHIPNWADELLSSAQFFTCLQP